MAATDFKTKCEILSELWVDYHLLEDRPSIPFGEDYGFEVDEEQLNEFFDYNDLGLPLSYALANDIVISTPLAENFINEAWELLINEVLRTDGKVKYSSLEELLETAGSLG